MTEAYPLMWPEGWPRTDPYNRDNIYGKFGHNLTIDRSRRRLQNELRLLGARDMFLSSNLKLRKDGEPRGEQRQPDDPGVAIYFERDHQNLCMAHDRWTKVEANINALALAIEGMRQMQRHGGGQMLKRAFTGFAALPPPNWRRDLGITNQATLADAETAYREKARTEHPDAGGTIESMAVLNRSIEAARNELENIK